MALPAPYNQYKYLNRFGANRHTVEYLTSALYGKGNRLGKGISIPLPAIDGVVETIPAGIAFNFVIEWATDNNYITSQESEYFNQKIFKSPESILTRLFTALQKRVIEPEHLLNDRLIANVAALDNVKKLQIVTPNNKFDPIAVVNKYNQEKLSIFNIITSQRGNLNTLVPTKLTADSKGQITTQSVAGIISDDFERLSYIYQTATEKYSDIEDDHERAILIGQELHQELNDNIQSKSPSHLAFAAQSYNQQDFVNLAMIVGASITTFEEQGGDINSLSSLKTQASQSLPILLPNQGEVYEQIVATLNSQEGHKVAEEIILELSRSAGEGIGAQELIKKVAANTNLSESQVNDLLIKLADTPTLVALDYHLAASTLSHQQIGYSFIDLQLKNQGINPTLIPSDLNEELTKLGINGSTNGDKNARYQENSRLIQTKLQEARTSGDISLIELLGDAANKNLHNYLATDTQRGLASLSRLNHKLATWKTKIQDTERAFFAKWHHFEENLPWNIAARQIIAQMSEIQTSINEAIYAIEAKYNLPKIPIFGLLGHISEQIRKFKMAQTTKAYRWISSWNSKRGRQIGKWLIRQYRHGDYSIGGAIFSGFRAASSSAYKWALTKATNSILWKKAADWGSKAFGGVLKKIGMQIGGKLATIAVAAASIASTILAALGLLSLAVDFVIKPVFGFMKRFLSDPFFAFKGLAIGSAILSIPATVSALLSAIIGGIGLALASIPILFATAVLVSIGLIALAVILYYSGTSFTPDLDPGKLPPSLTGYGSPHIALDKKVQGSISGNKISNLHLDQTLQYTITVTAVDIPLKDIVIVDTPSITTDTNPAPTLNSQTFNIPSLEPGETKTFTYEIKLNSRFKDSYLSNTVALTSLSAQNTIENSSKSLGLIIGNPPLLPLPEFARKLALAIAQAYGSEVKIEDGGQKLLDLNDPQINQEIVNILINSTQTTNSGYLQCVGFTRAALKGVGIDLPTKDYAYMFLSSPPAGFVVVDGPPLPGDLFVIGTERVSVTGHIGVVIEVRGDTVVVADANTNSTGNTAIHSYPISYITGFLRKP